jgi:hypothetical protein
LCRLTKTAKEELLRGFLPAQRLLGRSKVLEYFGCKDAADWGSQWLF